LLVTLATKSKVTPRWRMAVLRPRARARRTEWKHGEGFEGRPWRLQERVERPESRRKGTRNMIGGVSGVSSRLDGQ
jgi:hypothetical protein